MKRQEFLLNLTLLIIIGALIFLIYDSKEQPMGLDELEIAPVSTAADGSSTGRSSRGRGSSGAADGGDDTGSDDDGSSTGTRGAIKTIRVPGSETEYGKNDDEDTTATAEIDGDNADADDEDDEIASAVATPGKAGNFGQRDLFRAILTPTPTPPPPTPTPAPTPNINTALGSWRLLSVYEGKAMMEDVKLSEAGAEGAIWEMAEGETKQVDTGDGSMKTVTLKKLDNENPYNPEVVFGLEDTKAEKKINLDTEPVTAAPQKK